jgi:hypothetical protein
MIKWLAIKRLAQIGLLQLAGCTMAIPCLSISKEIHSTLRCSFPFLHSRLMDYYSLMGLGILAVAHLPVLIAFCWFQYTQRDHKVLVRVQLGLSVWEVLAAIWLLSMLTAELEFGAHGVLCVPDP